MYNNEEQLNSQLLYSLKKQTVNIEKILIDNREHQFHCAAEALNYGASLANGDVLIFAHQDIFIKEIDGVQRFAQSIMKCEVGDVIGTQGVREESKVYYSNLTAGEQYISSKLHEYDEHLIQVDCFDEGFFGMKKTTWEKHRFDEEMCDDWHLYAVEMCLYARLQKHKVYIYPLEMHHFSYGKITKAYMYGLKKICNKYRKNFKYIWTTCYKVRTNRLYINMLVFAWILNRKLRKRST